MKVFARLGLEELMILYEVSTQSLTFCWYLVGHYELQYVLLGVISNWLIKLLEPWSARCRSRSKFIIIYVHPSLNTIWLCIYWGGTRNLVSINVNLLILIWLFSSGFRTRPRKLKVVINPRSKKGKARLVYLKQVAPLFERAGIKADIMSKLKAERLI